MKATESFKKIVNDHLQKIAEADQLFAKTLNKPNKSIDGCINYIFSTVQKSGFNGFADEEVFAMAIHYFDEDVIENVKPINGKVVVNRTVSAAEKSSVNSSNATVQAKVKSASKKSKAPAAQMPLFG